MSTRRVTTWCVSVLAAGGILGGATPAGAGRASGVTLSRAETALLVTLNDVRVQHGLAPFQVGTKLERAARFHSLDMLRGGYFAHGDFAGRMARFGVSAAAIGENLAWGTGSYGSASSIVRLWLNSPPHRANLLRPGFRRIGIAALVGSFDGYGGATVVTADFAGT